MLKFANEKNNTLINKSEITENRLKMQVFFKRFTWLKSDSTAVESLAVFKKQIEDLKLYNMKLMNRIEFLESTLSISGAFLQS